MNTGKKKWQVAYQRTIEYDIIAAPGLFQADNEALLSPGRRENAHRFVVVDQNVQSLYSAQIRDYFSSHRIEAKIIGFPAGEQNKSIAGALSILRELDSFPICRRDEPIIAIGGGVLTDVVGFVASIYRRGIPHINVPTTLMGYIDAAVGIKTGLNFNGHKNRLGSFNPPLRVLLDKIFLKSLPERHILNGVCEMVKLGLIKDPLLFTMLEESGVGSISACFQDDAGEALLDRSIDGMIDEIQPNLFEENLARKVDFGHTFAYGLETRPGADLLHGEAVLLDIALSIQLARLRGLLSEQDLERIFRLIFRLGLPLNPGQLEAGLLWESLQERTRHRNGMQRVPLPDGIGECVFINDIRLEEIRSAVKQLNERMVVANGEIYQRQ